jgi:hypothetical protein
MTVQAIETQYKGYRFRSRLEARWAVFFDALDIKWEYEKEGYKFDDGTQYLPDFWLTDLEYFVEVKGQMTDKDFIKIHNLCRSTRSTVILLGSEAFLANSGYYQSKFWRFFYLHVPDSFVGTRNFHDLCFCQCKKCKKIIIACEDLSDPEPRQISDCFCDDGMAKSEDIDTYPDIVKTAFQKAKSARFEFGESG